ncbi:hypothetical protein CROQUDRAFT_720452 [Cronartium quercuum f. sp. fusiforme G11]|uniref:PH domain-containing protein n=1 Tax=Cronartium quercuum f. sp. fusiforme G11 TaxID=708437 RepID=A0A9P6NU54_9BASI|nr:hypothetical protein CROQUDRAFT_720452 [Cronartium quercuum f. sp. fusiforme G11]
MTGNPRRVQQLSHQFENKKNLDPIPKPISYSSSINYLRKRKLVMSNSFESQSPAEEPRKFNKILCQPKTTTSTSHPNISPEVINPTILLTPASNPTTSGSASPNINQSPKPPTHELKHSASDPDPTSQETTLTLQSRPLSRSGSYKSLRNVTPPAQSTQVRKIPSIRMSPGVKAMLNNSRSNSLSSVDSVHSPRLNRLPSDGSSANLTQPSPAGNQSRLFSPRSTTTTTQTSLPQDSSSSVSNPEQGQTIPGWVPTTLPLRKLSQRSNQSSLFGSRNMSSTNRDQLHPRPSTSIGTYPELSSTEEVYNLEQQRKAHSSLPPTDYPDSSDKDLPSFSYCNGDKGIEELLETLGYSAGFKSKTPTGSLMRSSSRDGEDRSSGRDWSQGRAPVVMLDIEGDEFTIHEHSLSPVSERTELSTISSKKSQNRQRSSANPQNTLSQRFISQNGFQSTAPLCLSPNKHLSPPTSSSTTSPKRRTRPESDRPNSSTSVSPNQDSTLGLNFTDRAKVFGEAKSIRPREFSHLNKSALSNDILSSPTQLCHLSPDDPQAATSRPSLQRIPKKATALIQMFEGGTSPASSSSPQKSKPPSSCQASTLALSHPAPINRLQYPTLTHVLSTPSQRSAFEALEASRRARAARQQRHYASGSAIDDLPTHPTRATYDDDRIPQNVAPSSPVTSTLGSTIEFSEAEQERIRLRNERRERVALAEKGQLAPPSPPKDFRTPISEQHIHHRKSIASSIATTLSDVQILQHGSIWYRNPETHDWRETRGLLTAEAVYLMNQNGDVDPSTGGQPIELSLRNCTAVESVRSKRAYGPDFSEPHLHILRIAWTEFDHSTNARVEHEEFLGCTRATQRADWVGAIWQVAHDLGGFIEQPDIPLAGKSTSSPSASPRPDPSTAQSLSQSPNEPGISTSPRLDAVTLVDRAMSVAESSRRLSASSSSFPALPRTHPAQPSSSVLSSSESVMSSATTTLQSELDRELSKAAAGSSSHPQPSTNHLYSEAASQMHRDALGELRNSEPGPQNDLIDPNLERQPSRAKSPELDIFAMLERMSVRGSIHNRTSQFYDAPAPPPPSAAAALLQSQRSPNMHNPQPISPAELADISALENDASSSHHSFHTMRPTSAAGVHERFLDSPRSSVAISSNHGDNQSTHSTPRHPRYTLQDPGKTPTGRVLSCVNSSPPSQADLPTPTGRGAWSDLERKSAQTDNNELLGALPRRAVQRDLQRILTTIERKDSKLIDESNSLGNHLDNIQTQLKNVADKLKDHANEKDDEANGNTGEEPTIADKVDYMLSLCNILLESQHKVSAAVEKNLKAHGVNLDSKSIHTRSMRSTTNTSRQSACESVPEPEQDQVQEPKPLSPLPEASLDEDQRSSFSRIPGSPPLPPLPTEEVPEPEPVPVEVAVQEAGLSRIENLLVALLSRMDEAAVVKQQPEAEGLNLPPPLPEKDEQSVVEEEEQIRRGLSMSSGIRSSTLDLDADVALWKSSGRAGPRAWPSSCSQVSEDRASSRSSDARPKPAGQRVYAPTETDNSDQQNYQMIPDYNQAYEAEDAVARRIAGERARAARRLEGLSTPYGMSRSSVYGGFDHQQQDHHQAVASPSQSEAQLADRNEKSHWSITTPSPDLDMPTEPPLPPPKDERPPPEEIILSPPPPMPPVLTLSERVQSLRSSRASTRPASVVSSTRSRPQQPLPEAPIEQPEQVPQNIMMMPPPQPAISTDEIKLVFKETLEDHSNQQAPMFDEMVNLLRTQDQVSQATVMNQAEVSRYLTQLNSHLEGVLQKKSEDVELITESVKKLQDQLGMLIEQSNRMALVGVQSGQVEQPMPDTDRGLTDGEGEGEGGGEGGEGQEVQQVEPEQSEQQGIHFEVEEGADVNVNTEVPEEGGGGIRQMSSMTKRPSAAHRIGGPRARKISLAGKSLRGPRMPTTLSNVGKLWGGPTPAADRAARWGGAAGGGTLKRAPTGKSAMTAAGEPVNVEGALAGLSGDETVVEGGGDVDERTGTIAMGVSHILKLLRENQTKEEERRRQKEVEKASQPKPTISDEMEQRRAKIEELQLRREATLAEDKAKNMEAIMMGMRQQAAEHDKLLKQIVEEMGKRKGPEYEEEEQRRRHEEAMEGVNRVLTTVESGVMTHLEEFKAQMFAEMKQTFEKVGELRDQKQQIQSDIADMLCFMSKVRGGGPDPRWQYPLSASSLPPVSVAGSVTGGDHGMATGYAPIPALYPTPQMDYPDRAELGPEVETKSTAGFGPRPPGRR